MTRESNVVPIEPRRRERPRVLDAQALANHGFLVFPIWPHENGRCACRDEECDKAG